jgi:hypothetical protein
MVFLRPVVLRDGMSYRGATAERYREMLGEQEKSQVPPHPVLPEYPGPWLPEIPAVPEQSPAHPGAPQPRQPGVKPPAAVSYLPERVW